MASASFHSLTLAARPEWSVSHCLCSAGPHDRPYEELHERFAVALVVQGTFEYRSPPGDAVLYPGAYLLGNTDECFECGHSHSTGDRCIALHARAEAFEEVAASVAGSARFRFRQSMLPARPELTRLAVMLQSITATSAALAADESVYHLLESLVSLLRISPPSGSRVAASDVRRLSPVLQYIEMHAASALELEQLASLAAMSKYHFLRTFRRVTGITPHRYLLSTRLRRAAAALAGTRLPVASIALDEGFNDLSTFNRYFRRMLKMTPNQYRSTFRLPRPG
jgi:AraC family transcriptional regulator